MPLTVFVNTLLETDSNFFDGNSFWDSITEEKREEALIFATQKLDQYYWLGTALTETQPLAWPRTSFSFFDPVLNLTVSNAEGDLPVRLSKAVAVIATHYAKNPSLSTPYTATFDKIKVGPIELENSSTDGSKNSVPEIPISQVLFLITPLFDTTVSNGVSRPWWRAN